MSNQAIRAEEAVKLTLQQAVDLALQNNLQIKADQARLAVSEAQVESAKARINPALVTDNGIAEKSYRLGMQQVIELGGKRKKRIAVAQAQKTTAMADIRIKILDLKSNVRKAYVQLYIAQARRQTYQDVLGFTKTLLDIAKKQEQAGDIAALDVLQAETATLNTENELETLQFQNISAQTNLNSLLALPVQSQIILTAPNDTLKDIEPKTLTKPLLAVLIEQAASNRPEVVVNEKSIALTQAQLNLALANRTPNATLEAGPDFVAGSNGSINAFILGTIELPLVNRQKGPIQEAIARRKQLTREQAALKNRIALEVTTAYTDYTANRHRIDRYEQGLLPKALQIVQKSQRSFQMGKSPILVSLNAQQAYIATQLGYLQTLADYQNAIIDLERAVGAE